MLEISVRDFKKLKSIIKEKNKIMQKNKKILNNTFSNLGKLMDNPIIKIPTLKKNPNKDQILFSIWTELIKNTILKIDAIKVIINIITKIILFNDDFLGVLFNK